MPEELGLAMWVMEQGCVKADHPDSSSAARESDHLPVQTVILFDLRKMISVDRRKHARDVPLKFVITTARLEEKQAVFTVTLRHRTISACEAPSFPAVEPEVADSPGRRISARSRSDEGIRVPFLSCNHQITIRHSRRPLESTRLFRAIGFRSGIMAEAF
jgi:hypothetical protein